MEDTVKERLVRFLKHERLSQAKFATKIGVSGGYVNNISKGIGAEVLMKISNTFPTLNTEWLLTGKGEMFYTAPYLKGIVADTEFPYYSNANKNKTVPLIPISAQAGKLTDFVTQTKKEDCEQVITPILDAEYAIRVAGDSMEPEYPNGSQILIKKIDEKIFIDWGKTYVLDTCNGTIIKKLMPATKEGYVKCVSINPDYPAFEVPITENAIFGVYRVIMCMSIK